MTKEKKPRQKWVECCGEYRVTNFCQECGRPLRSLATSYAGPNHDAVIACYLRVSTDQQDVKNQQPEMIDWADRQPDEVIWFTETGSGTNMDRPGFNALMHQVRQGRIKTICIWKLDRLGRTTAGLLNLLKELNVYGVSLVSIREGIDFGTPLGKIVFTVLALAAELENDARHMRQKAANDRIRRLMKSKDPEEREWAKAEWKRRFQLKGGRVRGSINKATWGKVAKVREFLLRGFTNKTEIADRMHINWDTLIKILGIIKKQDAAEQQAYTTHGLWSGEKPEKLIPLQKEGK
jgi:DNA invertase Pin-like site-specific DNA recombinase